MEIFDNFYNHNSTLIEQTTKTRSTFMQDGNWQIEYSKVTPLQAKHTHEYLPALVVGPMTMCYKNAKLPNV